MLLPEWVREVPRRFGDYELRCRRCNTPLFGPLFTGTDVEWREYPGMGHARMLMAARGAGAQGMKWPLGGSPTRPVQRDADGWWRCRWCGAYVLRLMDGTVGELVDHVYKRHECFGMLVAETLEAQDHG